ncbi:sodium-coupled neutral amino acid transporter 4 [Prunus yedoensis var. nudiflora]|uniref:Sodium-coupled neutral amino acid transporter 4 n=1 Tax=Prunus yedoensis var. nudiflora TaxID=2094558 RepID=A0A314UXC6_PRUYE|nr:sodium-coupled neutral amino acid transporter 4 [Prunus yedoensis var. nudiflora]
MTSANPENMLKHNKENSDKRVPLLSRTQDEKVMTDKYSGASFHGSVFNLSCTIVGSGIMSLPATLKMLGLVPGIVLIIIVAFVIEASIEMLLRFSKAGYAYSYGDAMADAFGRIGKVLLQICIVIYNTGSLIVYMIIIEDVLSGSTSKEVHHAGILEGWFGEHWWTSRAFVLVAVTVFIFFPLMFFERIDSARYISVISVGLAIVFLLVVIGVTTFKLVDGSIETPKWFPAVTDSTSFLNLFTAVPVVVFAYICHYNVHTIQNELADSSLIQGVVRGSLALCAVVYVMTGIFGFLLFGESTYTDLLSNFDTDIGVPYSSLFNNIVRISYAGHVILVFPTIFLPLRLNLDGLLFPSARPLALDKKRFVLESVGLVLISLVGAISIPNIWVAFEFTGATMGGLLAFVFPASITLKDPHCIATTKDKIVSVSMIILAVVSNVMAIYSNLSSFLS